jgi:exodeoxyribonuclease VIII
MSNEEYHASPEFSSSQLKDILRSSAHFYSNNILKENERESKKHFDFGTLAHTLFLEPEQFENEFVIGPKFDRRTKEGKAEAAAWEAANQGKIIIDQEMLEGATRIAENLRSLSSYEIMQNNPGMAEASIFFTDPIYGLNLRVRPDYHIIPCDEFPNGLIMDVKTSTDARQFKFSKSCADFGYDISAAMYREGFQQYYKTEEMPEFFFLVAESTAPFNVKQYRASSLFLSIGEQRYNKAKELLAESLLINEWDGYPTELEDITLPQYMLKQAIENEFN